MAGDTFSTIAAGYRAASTAQRSAADILFSLLELSGGDEVLDVGCGAGNLTQRIHEVTGARTVGVDPSEGMIAECGKLAGGGLSFLRCAAEEMVFQQEFDVVFSNSAFQWVKDPATAARAMRAALRVGGRLGLQAPGGAEYCPNFIRAVEAVRRHPRWGQAFSRFRAPWIFYSTAAEYAAVFTGAGFRVRQAEMRTLAGPASAEQAFGSFCSAAIAGYLNPDCYDQPITEEFVQGFKDAVHRDFERQAGTGGAMELVFNRVFVIADR
jgi:trans-aconitate 2-methyltransferase